MGKELIAIVNENDKPIGEIEIREVHEKGLLHREVYVFIISHKRVILQRRANRWTCSIEKHCSLNEDYLQAAQREFQELGIYLPENSFYELCFQRFKTICSREINDRFAKAFLVLRKNIPLTSFHADKTKFAKARYFCREEVYSLIKEKKWLTDYARGILKKYILRELC